MEKRFYLTIFSTIVISLAIGFTLGAQGNAPAAWHSLAELYTNNSQITLADANSNDIIDNSDNVVDIGSNIVMGYALHNIIAPLGGGALPYNAWVQLPVGQLPNIPTTADYAIIEYDLTSVPPACPTVNLEFTDNPNNLIAAAVVHVSHTDVAGASGRHGQAIVPLAPGTGKTWFKYSYGPPPIGAGAPCAYAVYFVGYID